jgi:hypothetical protein
METTTPTYTQKPFVDPRDFDTDVELPYDLTIEAIRATMEDVYETLFTINSGLTAKGLDRLEETLLGNSFSGLLSELVVKGLARHSDALARNIKVGGHPDLIPAGKYPSDSVLQGEGVEVKMSIQTGGWQGHNPEAGWIMVFQYSKDVSTRPVHKRRPSEYLRVLIAKLEREDWSFSGRRGQSRRTPTASILKSGTQKLLRSAIYELGRGQHLL